MFEFCLLPRSDSFSEYIDREAYPEWENSIANDHKLAFKTNDFFIYQQWVLSLSPLMISEGLNKSFKILHAIGEGHFAKVFLAEVLPHSLYFNIYEKVAIKKI